MSCVCVLARYHISWWENHASETSRVVLHPRAQKATAVCSFSWLDYFTTYSTCHVDLVASYCLFGLNVCVIVCTFQWIISCGTLLFRQGQSPSQYSSRYCLSSLFSLFDFVMITRAPFPVYVSSFKYISLGVLMPLCVWFMLFMYVESYCK